MSKNAKKLRAKCRKMHQSCRKHTGLCGIFKKVNKIDKKALEPNNLRLSSSVEKKLIKHDTRQ